MSQQAGDESRWWNPLGMSPVRLVVAALILTSAYVAFGLLGLKAADVTHGATPIWAPSGIGLAVAVLFGPWSLCTTFLGQAIIGLLRDYPYWPLLAMCIGDLAEVSAGWFLFVRVCKVNPGFIRLSDVRCLLLTAGGCSILAAFTGAGGMTLAEMVPRAAFGNMLFSWWLGDLMGILIVAPAILTWFSRDRSVVAGPSRIQQAVLVSGVALANLFVFARFRAESVHFPVPFLVFPFAIFMALQCGPRGAILGSTITAVISIVGTLEGFGPFGLEPFTVASLYLVMVFVAVVSITSLVIGATVAERAAASEALRETETRNRALLDAMPDLMFLQDSQGVYLDFHALDTALLIVPPEEFLGKRMNETLPTGVVRIMKPAFDRALSSGEPQVVEYTSDRTGETRHLEARLVRCGEDRVLTIVRNVTARKRSEAALLASESRHRFLYNNTPVMMHSIDREGRLVSVSDFWLAKMGYTREEVIGRKSVEFLTEASAQYARSTVLPSFMATGVCTEVPYQFVRKDGQIIEALLSAIAERDQDGSVLRSLAVVIDVTDRVRAQEAAFESDLRFESVAQGIGEGILITDLDRRITYANPRIAALCGYAAEELHGELDFQLLDFQEEADSENPVVGQRWASRSKSFESPIRHRDGSRFWALVSITPYRGTEGRVTGRIVAITDITQRVNAEMELRESEERFRQIAESIDQVFWLYSLDPPGTMYLSPVFESIWDRTRDEVYADDGKWGEFIYPDDRDRVAKAFREWTSMRAPHYEEEFRIMRPDGSMRWILDTGTLILDETGRPFRVSGVAKDITVRKQFEEQLQEAQRLESIGQLAGGVAHDFNNLLTAMIGYLELSFAEVESNTLVRGYLENALVASRRATDLTSQLLAFARKQIIAPRLVNLNELIRESESIIRRLIGEGITLLLRLKKNLGAVKVDPGQFHQVLINLAVNARDAMSGVGKLVIETDRVVLDADYARVHTDVTPGEYVMLAVGDTGQGMSVEVSRRIFEPFFTTKEQGKGTGLGLATCYGIVKQNAGHINLYSEVGCGTVFKVYLPRQATLEVEAAEQALDTAAPVGTETILLAEDEPLVRELAALTLRAQGYTVIEAANGLEALTAADDASRTIDLLVTDVVMPEMSGDALAERLEELFPGVRTLYISGYTDSAIVDQGVLEPGVEFLQKPFTTTALAQKVRAVLDESQT